MEIVPYTSADASDVAELLNAGLARKLVGARDVDYWNWKHEQNPFGRSLMLLARAHGQVVGIRAFLRWELVLDQLVIRVAKPVDSVTHPDFQRRGIFSQLTKTACELAAQQGIVLLFNTPNENSKPGYLKLGWQELGGLSLGVNVRRPMRATFRALRWKFAGPGVPSSEQFFRSPPKPASSLVEDQRTPELLANRSTAAGQLETHRSLEFLRWRYSGHPHIKYFVETVESEGRLDGAVLYRTNSRGGIGEIMIDDLLVRQGNASCVVPKLLQHLAASTRADYWILHMSNRTECYNAVRAQGFHAVPRKRITLVARSLGGEPSCAADLERWALCMGDLEGL